MTVEAHSVKDAAGASADLCGSGPRRGFAPLRRARHLASGLIMCVLVAFGATGAIAQSGDEPDVVEAITSGLPMSLGRERVEADISTRQVAIESDFSGVQLIVFGTVVGARPLATAEPAYDVAIVVEGPRQSVNVRRKERVAGIWVNTQSRLFKAVPSYYGILTTRPADMLARKPIRRWLGVGFENLKLLPAATFADGEVELYRDALVRLKQRQGLYRSADAGVTFKGSSLFRARLDLPANVSVGQFNVAVHLFRDGAYLDTHRSRVVLRRQGLERAVHDYAFDFPLFYGLTAVVLAVIAGFTASAIFQRD